MSTMSGGTFQSLEEVVLCFYESNNPKRSEAQAFLNELQNSRDIWRIIWEQMLPSKRTELQFYGATILHSKILNDWEQLPMSEYDNLKSKLFEAILYFKDESKLVQNRLCMTLASYVLRMTPAKWPNAISDIISTFQPQNLPNVPEDVLANTILDILCVIPEQFQTMFLSKNEKILIKGAMDAESLTVLSLLENTLQSQSPEIISQSLKCAKSWLEFGLPIECCSNLLDLCINIVMATYNNSEISGYSVSALEAVSIIFNHPCNEKYENTVTSFIKKILRLNNLLKENSLNSDFLPCLCTLYVDIGDSQMKLLLKLLGTENRDITLEILKIILHCSDAPGDYPVDEVYSAHTFNFWYQLQDELLCCDPCDPSVFQIVKPFYKLLIPILLKKSTYPEKISKWSKQDQDTFRCHRQDIADTYMYCYAVLQEDIVETLFNGLTYEVYNRDTVTSRWRQIEAYLHAFVSLSERLAASEYELVIRFLTVVYSLPFSDMNPRISLTAMELIGAYAVWYANHPDVLGSALNFVLEGILNKHVSSSASVALKEITRECQPVIYSYASDALIACEKALDKKHLDYNEELRVIFAIGKLLSVVPSEIIIHHLEILVPSYIDQLNSNLTNQEGIRKNKVAHCVNIFTQLFLSLETCSEPKPTYYLLSMLLPIYKEVLKHDESKLQMAVCDSLRCAVNNLGDTCGDLTPVIIDLIIVAYQQNSEYPFLDVAKQVLIFFGNNSNYFAILSNMIRNVCTIALERIRMSPDGNMSDHTLLIQHFYLFCTNLIKKHLNLFTNTPGIDMTSMFRYASLALRLQESATVKPVANFLSNVISISREINAFSPIVQADGVELVREIIMAIAKSAPRPCMEPVTDVLMALNKKYCDWLSRWLHEVLAPDNFPSPRATSSYKNRFIKTVLRERGNRRKVLETVREFAFVCRGIMNKDYIEETTSPFF